MPRRGLEPPRSPLSTDFSSLHVCQFHHLGLTKLGLPGRILTDDYMGCGHTRLTLRHRLIWCAQRVSNPPLTILKIVASANVGYARTNEKPPVFGGGLLRKDRRLQSHTHPSALSK